MLQPSCPLLFIFLGECTAFKDRFMKCLRDQGFDNSKCRLQSKEYLECRMDQWEMLFLNERNAASSHLLTLFVFNSSPSQLMTKEPLEKLGFRDLKDSSPKQTDGNPELWILLWRRQLPSSDSSINVLVDETAKTDCTKRITMMLWGHFGFSWGC